MKKEKYKTKLDLSRMLLSLPLQLYKYSQLNKTKGQNTPHFQDTHNTGQGVK